MSGPRGDKPHIHYLHPGPWPVHIGFTTDARAFDREMARLKVEGVAMLKGPRAAATTHVLTRSGSLLCVIAMVPPSRRQGREQYAALLAHEAVHVVQEIGEELSAGAPLGKEAEAYLVQMIVQDCLQIAWQTGRTRRIVPL